MSMTKKPRTTRCSMSSMLMPRRRGRSNAGDDALLVAAEDGDDGEVSFGAHAGMALRYRRSCANSTRSQTNPPARCEWHCRDRRCTAMRRRSSTFLNKSRRPLYLLPCAALRRARRRIPRWPRSKRTPGWPALSRRGLPRPGARAVHPERRRRGVGGLEPAPGQAARRGRIQEMVRVCELGPRADSERAAARARRQGAQTTRTSISRSTSSSWPAPIAGAGRRSSTC